MKWLMPLQDTEQRDSSDRISLKLFSEEFKVHSHRWINNRDKSVKTFFSLSLSEKEGIDCSRLDIDGCFGCWSEVWQSVALLSKTRIWSWSNRVVVHGSSRIWSSRGNCLLATNESILRTFTTRISLRSSFTSNKNRITSSFSPSSSRRISTGQSTTCITHSLFSLSLFSSDLIFFFCFSQLNFQLQRFLFFEISTTKECFSTQEIHRRRLRTVTLFRSSMTSPERIRTSTINLISPPNCLHTSTNRSNRSKRITILQSIVPEIGKVSEGMTPAFQFSMVLSEREREKERSVSHCHWEHVEGSEPSLQVRGGGGTVSGTSLSLDVSLLVNRTFHLWMSALSFPSFCSMCLSFVVEHWAGKMSCRRLRWCKSKHLHWKGMNNRRRKRERGNDVDPSSVLRRFDLSGERREERGRLSSLSISLFFGKKSGLIDSFVVSLQLERKKKKINVMLITRQERFVRRIALLVNWKVQWSLSLLLLLLLGRREEVFASR